MRVLPSDVQAEREVLAILLNDNKYIDEVLEDLKVEHFYNSNHKIIFSEILKLYEKNIPVDLVTLRNSFGDERLQSIGGISYLAELTSSFVTGVNIKSYSGIIKEKSKQRGLIKSCTLAIERIYKNETTDEIVLELEESIYRNTVEEGRQAVLSDNELMDYTLSDIEKNYLNGGEIIGIKTGLKSLDNATNGLRKGDLIIIGGRPSMGKTCFALNIMDGISREGNKTCLFELEMTAEKLGARRIASQGMVNANKLPKGSLDEKEWEKVIMTASTLANKNNIFTDCSSQLTMLDIKSRAKKIKRKHGLDVIIIDHLTLITPSRKNDRNDLQIAEITRQSKIIAKELDVAVILLAQLNRAVEQRNDKRPMLSDLRESGAIEQDADIVMFMYRDEYYDKESEEKNILECIIAKQRDGRTGTIKFAYLPQYQRIAELDLR